MTNDMRRVLGFITGIILTGTVYGQDMNKGFEMLESGDFVKAESFFSEVLKQYPDNKTAKICYGRATGLAGNPSEALAIFEALDALYPNDNEVLLNKAESYLWSKDGRLAIVVYDQILSEDSSNFAATLGIANSYSMEKQYEQAYNYILIAEQAQPDNAQVALSKKFIILGYANQLASEKNAYDDAIELIDMNLQRDAQDQESLKLKSTVYLISGSYDKALAIYQVITDPVASAVGRSVSKHLLGEDRQALQIAKEAKIGLLDISTDEKVRLQNHYIAALLWNSKIREAQMYSDSLVKQHPDNLEFILSQAQVAVYASDYIQGVEKYEDYLKWAPSSFNANLGKADAIHALGMDNQAYGQAFEAIKYYPGQKDITNFVGKLNKIHSPQVTAKYMYGKSSDGSQMQGYNLSGSLSLGPLSTIGVSYQQKRLASKVGTYSNSETYALSGSKRLNATVKLSAAVAQIIMDYNNEQSVQKRWDIDVNTDIRVNKNLNLTLSYLNEVQDFNEALLIQNLKIQHIVAKSSFFWKLQGLGSYTEAYRSYYSDGNSRNLLFTSLYKTFVKIKPLKVGTNYLFMSFAESKPAFYYSPEQYHQTEAFLELNFKEGEFLPVSIYWSLAGGYQIADQMSQPTWRTAIQVSRELGRFKFLVKGGYSTIVAMQTNGFSHLTLEGSLRIRLANRPIFYKRIQASQD